MFVFSPPAWGWSAAGLSLDLLGVVLPTRVGMVRDDAPHERRRPRSPHPRGDGPAERDEVLEALRFSPPAWGWSVRTKGRTQRPTVLPTRVGMVRFVGVVVAGLSRSPHPRGDGPICR